MDSLARIEEKLDQLLAVLERFMPLLERYEQAAKANGRLKQRHILKGM
jgi:hypothetical protein